MKAIRIIGGMQQHRPHSPLSDQLDREWRRLARRRLHVAELRTWRSGDDDLDRRVRQHLADAASLDQLLDRCHRRHARTADDLLHWLLLVGRRHPLAHRVVVQRTLPLVIAGARHQRGARLSTSPIDDAITSLTMAVATADFPIGTIDIAPRIAGRAFHDAFRKQHRRRHHSDELPTSPLILSAHIAPEREANPIVVTARFLEIARRSGVRDDTVDLARRLARGDSTADIAADRRCTDRTIRNRRASAVEALRAVADRHGIDRNDHDSLLGLATGHATGRAVRSGGAQLVAAG